jgi:hypothetical protein
MKADGIPLHMSGSAPKIIEGRPTSDYDQAITRAGNWLRSQQRPDGSSGDNLPLWAYYTQPMAFRAAGATKFAVRTLDYIKRQFLKENGVLKHERGGVEGVTYAPSWTTVSAQMWDRFDISYPVSEWILQFQDPKTGGLFTTQEDAQKKRGIIELDATLVSGLALISTGRILQAEKIGEYLLSLHKSQPDRKNRYYFMWHSEKGLITDSYDEKLSLWYVVDKHKQRQGYFQFGLTIGFLSRLYMATGKTEYLKLAKEHFEFADDCEGVYASALAHKLCWACANLYVASSEVKHLEAAKKVGDHLISVQRDDGRYHYRDLVPNFEDQSLVDNLDTVSQFTTWIGSVRPFLLDS